MNRRQFLLSLILTLSGFKAHAGSFDPEDLETLRMKNSFDAASLEKLVSRRYLNLLNQGKKLNDGVGKKVMDASAQNALESIARPLWSTSTRSDLNWNIVLTDSPVINACTPGGGVVLVNRGLLAACSEEAELASVIAHEIGHIQHRHAIRRIMALTVQQEMGVGPSGLTGKKADDASMEMLMEKAVDIIHLSYRRLNEFQADAFIIHAFLKAGYPTAKASLFFRKLMKINGHKSLNTCIYSTHPLTAERISRLDALAASYGNQDRSYADSEAFEFLKNLP